MKHFFSVPADAKSTSATCPWKAELRSFSRNSTELYIQLQIRYAKTREMKRTHVGVWSVYQLGHPDSQETAHADNCSAAFGNVVSHLPSPTEYFRFRKKKLRVLQMWKSTAVWSEIQKYWQEDQLTFLASGSLTCKKKTSNRARN